MLVKITKYLVIWFWYDMAFNDRRSGSYSAKKKAFFYYSLQYLTFHEIELIFLSGE